MAISEGPTQESWIAATTFSSTSIYKFVCADAEGHAIDASNVGSSNIWPIGSLYSQTRTTTTEAESVTVATWGVVKVQAVESTMHAGNVCAASTAGYAIAPSTDYPIVGVVKYGSSGGTGRVLSVQLWKTGQTTTNPVA